MFAGLYYSIFPSSIDESAPPSEYSSSNSDTLSEFSVSSESMIERETNYVEEQPVYNQQASILNDTLGCAGRTETFFKNLSSSNLHPSAWKWEDDMKQFVHDCGIFAVKLFQILGDREDLIKVEDYRKKMKLYQTHAPYRFQNPIDRLKEGYGHNNVNECIVKECMKVEINESNAGSVATVFKCFLHEYPENKFVIKMMNLEPKKSLSMAGYMRKYMEVEDFKREKNSNPTFQFLMMWFRAVYPEIEKEFDFILERIHLHTHRELMMKRSEFKRFRDVLIKPPELIESVPSRNTKVAVLCSSTTLVMTHLGQNSQQIIEVLKNMRGNQATQEIIRCIVDSFGYMILQVGEVHADPHPGNLYVTVDESGGDVKYFVELIDFGSVVTLSRQQKQVLKEVILNVLPYVQEKYIEGKKNMRKNHMFDETVKKAAKAFGFVLEDTEEFNVDETAKQICMLVSTKLFRKEYKQRIKQNKTTTDQELVALINHISQQATCQLYQLAKVINQLSWYIATVDPISSIDTDDIWPEIVKEDPPFILSYIETEIKTRLFQIDVTTMLEQLEQERIFFWNSETLALLLYVMCNKEYQQHQRLWAVHALQALCLKMTFNGKDYHMLLKNGVIVSLLYLLQPDTDDKIVKLAAQTLSHFSNESYQYHASFRETMSQYGAIRYFVLMLDKRERDQDREEILQNLCNFGIEEIYHEEILNCIEKSDSEWQTLNLLRSYLQEEGKKKRNSVPNSKLGLLSRVEKRLKDLGYPWSALLFP